MKMQLELNSFSCTVKSKICEMTRQTHTIVLASSIWIYVKVKLDVDDVCWRRGKPLIKMSVFCFFALNSLSSYFSILSCCDDIEKRIYDDEKEKPETTQQRWKFFIICKYFYCI